MELIIDNRETIKNYFIEKQNQNNYEWVTFQNLDLGDYLFKYNNQPILIIERKTIEDLASSIRDGRYREQKTRLLNTYNKKNILYLIEGDLMCENKSIKFNKVNKYTIYSTLFNLYLRDNFNIFISYSYEHTIDFLENIAKKIEKHGMNFIENNDIKNENEDEIENYTKNLLTTINHKKINNITPKIVYKMQLCTIPNISSKYADTIIEKYPTLVSLIQDLTNYNYNEKIDIIKNLESIKEDKKRKLGIKVATNLIDNIFQDN